MTTEKIAVSLPVELVEEARRAVADGSARSVSAYVADAMAQRKRSDQLRDLLDDMDREHGPPSPDDFAWADDMLGLGG